MWVVEKLDGTCGPKGCGANLGWGGGAEGNVLIYR